MKTKEEVLKGCEHDGSYIPVNEVRRCMEEYASQFTPQWIKVTDRLPDEYSRVVIYKLDYVLICLGIAIYSNKKFMFDATMLKDKDLERLSDKPIMGVTHYLLLPEMPEV